jgi:hypothetical protein
MSEWLPNTRRYVETDTGGWPFRVVAEQGDRIDKGDLSGWRD